MRLNPLYNLLIWTIFLLGMTLTNAVFSQGITENETDSLGIVVGHGLVDDQAEIDSLVRLLLNEEETIEKVNVYLQLSEKHLDKDHSEALRYSKEGLALAINIQNLKGMLDCNLSIAHIYLAYVVDFEKSLVTYEDALGIALELKDREAEMRIYRGISYVYSSLENFDAAKDYLNRSLEIARELGDQAEMSSLNAYLGGMYEDEGDTLKAIECYQVVLGIEEEARFANTSNPSIVVIAHYYFLIDDIKESIKFYRIALKRFQREWDNRWLSYMHSCLANLYYHQGNLERAEAHAINGLSIAQHFNLSKEINDNYLVLIDITEAMGKHDLSERYKKAYDNLLARITEDKEAINSKVDLITLFEEADVYNERSAIQVAPMNRFLSAVMITMPVLLFLLLMAMPSRPKGA